MIPVPLIIYELIPAPWRALYHPISPTRRGRES